jgi:predicted dehydrogenase
MKPLDFAIVGAGFWSRYQLSGWRELEGVRCVAICDRVREKAQRLAAEFDVPAVHDDAATLLDRERLDFVDIISDPATHAPLVHLAIDRGVAAIVQKPMATTLAEASGMVDAARRAGVPLFVHENWRWQPPLRALQRLLDEEPIGTPFRARLTFTSAFPVFENQPFLKQLEQFIITDVGSHILDTARFLFGEVAGVTCRTARTRPDIRGENVATILLDMRSGMTVVCEMGYASRSRHECFPQTRILVEGAEGSLELDRDHWIHVTRHDRQRAERFPCTAYPWADPAYDVIHSSIVGCNENLLAALRGEAAAETTGADNLETMRLIFACYESAASGEVVHFG